MRNAFVRALEQRAADDSRVVLLSGDIGNRMFDAFKESHPERFYNCGVAEANMMSVAAAMALDGLRPVVYTIAPFVTTRCLEQIKVDVCYHQAPVVIVGVGGGLSYASLGSTHHALEDLAELRTLPRTTVLCPGDAPEVDVLFQRAMDHNDHHPGAVYLRLGKKNEPVVHTTPPDVGVARSTRVRESGQSAADVCLLACGTVLPAAVAAAERLAALGVAIEVWSMPSVKPLDEETLSDCFSQGQLVVTWEEHALAGGFGSAVSEWLTDRAAAEGAWPRSTLLRIGVADQFVKSIGSVDRVRADLGMDPPAVACRIHEALRTTRSYS